MSLSLQALSHLVRYAHNLSRNISLFLSFLLGAPWLVFCSTATQGADLAAPEQLLWAARANGASPDLKIGLIDCKGMLPSKKTVLQRFGLGHLESAISRGTGFFVGNTEAPRAIPSEYLSRFSASAGAALVKAVSKELAAKSHRITTQGELDSNCLKRKACVLVMHKGRNMLASAANALQQAAKAFRGISFALLDVDKYRVDFNNDSFQLPLLDVAAQEGRWPKVLALRANPSPVPIELRADPAKAAKKHPVQMRGMPFRLTDFESMNAFLDAAFGPAEGGVLPETKAVERVSQLGRPSLATPVESDGPVLINRIAEAKERIRKKKEASERRKLARQQMQRERERLAKMEGEGLVKPVNPPSAATGDADAAAAAEAGASTADAMGSVDVESSGNSAQQTKPASGDDDDDEVIVVA